MTIIQEKNRIIAEFMQPCIKGGKYYRTVAFGRLKYNSSWDWLMPVVQKIEKMAYKFNIYGDYLMGRHNEVSVDGIGIGDFTRHFKSEEVNSKINIVYDAVYQLILWYNQQSKTDKSDLQEKIS